MFVCFPFTIGSEPTGDMGAITTLPETPEKQCTLLLAQCECGILERNKMRVEKMGGGQLNVFQGPRWDFGVTDPVSSSE